MIKQLAWKALLFTLPFWMVVALYYHDDPFMVLRRYAIYDSDVTLNEAYTGWNIYKNRRESLHINSFILGNSCTMAFPCGEWEKHLNENDHSVRLSGNAESMKAILLKLQALERDHAEIKNVLMILDRTSLAKTSLQSSFSFILPPDISRRNSFSIQMEFLQAFILPDFLFPYLKYRITGTVSPSMKYMNPYGRVRNSLNNDAINPRERMITQEGEAYWKNHQSEFPPRDGLERTAERAIYQPQRALLNEIADLLRTHHTSIRLIISPDYNQKKLHPADKEALDLIFGRGNVFDFSGINKYTADYHYYYEQGHYRPLLGVKLLDNIYNVSE